MPTSNNRRILNATPVTSADGINMRSKTELRIYNALRSMGFSPRYEEETFTYWEGCRPTVPFYDMNPQRRLRRNMHKLVDMRYTPDFIFMYEGVKVLIEVKGWENDQFAIRKKLFRQYLETVPYPVVYAEIFTRKQLVEFIDELKQIAPSVVEAKKRQLNMTRKSLYDISWKISEPEYREDPALSYSTLAKYERGGGFKSLPTLFDKVSSASLTFGSIVDTLITGTEEDFRNSFIVAEDPGISDNLKEITTTLYERYKEQYSSFDEIPDEILAEVGKEFDYYASDKFVPTRIKKIRESCKPYYNMLLLAEGKTVVTQEDITDARACVEVLKNGNVAAYFQDADPLGNGDIEGFYQLKFKGVDPLTGVEYRCMADRILVNHAAKVVLPIDLKTSSHEEHEFYKSFTQWRYKFNNYWKYFRNTRVY